MSTTNYIFLTLLNPAKRDIAIAMYLTGCKVS